ncbi:MAG: fumarylacetoacetate hydrolase family protein, partial [Angustibacter sp.]
MLAVPLLDGSPYGLDHLPLGVFTPGTGGPARVGVRVGDLVLDAAAAAEQAGRGLPRELVSTLRQPSLNPLMALGRPSWNALRTWLTDMVPELVREPLPERSSDPATDERHPTPARSEAPAVALLHPVEEVVLHLPIEVADYVDFYASEHHATNVGRIFRPDGEPLTPNWKHLPIGYHGRAGTVVVSGTDVVRPQGQCKAATDAAPGFGPSRRLDIEAEVGFVVGVPSRLGVPVPVDAFADHVFGVVLLNDWSARDVQAWEYVPLGPFLGKSFATSVSAWVTPLDAL